MSAPTSRLPLSVLRSRLIGALSHLRVGMSCVLLLLGLFVVGCGETGPELAKVKGQLFVGGEPAAQARVILNPGGSYQPDDWPGGKPNATVNDDGSFVVTTPSVGEGVPPGDYKITVIWLVPAPGSEPDDPEPDMIDRLQGRYAKVENSDITVDIQMPETTLDRIDFEE